MIIRNIGYASMTLVICVHTYFVLFYNKVLNKILEMF